jgi:hypothetical protein
MNASKAARTSSETFAPYIAEGGSIFHPSTAGYALKISMHIEEMTA